MTAAQFLVAVAGLAGVVMICAASYLAGFRAGAARRRTEDRTTSRSALRPGG